MATRRGIKSGTNWTPLGAYLRDKRTEMGVTQKDMARAIGVSPAYLSALEHGQRGKPSFVLLQRLIGYLGVIWDEADHVQKLADLSDPRVVVDTQHISAEATELANQLAAKIGTLDDAQITALLTLLSDAPDTSDEDQEPSGP